MSCVFIKLLFAIGFLLLNNFEVLMHIQQTPQP